MINQFDWAAKWANYSPQKIAFKEYETKRQLSFEELNNLGNKLSQYLFDSFNIKKGDRIAVLAENCLEYLLLFVTAQKTGFILVPLNYRLANSEIEYLIQNSKPKLVIAESKFTLKIENFISSEKGISYLPMSNLMDLSKDYPVKASSSRILIQENDPIFILYTSGTTGFPKGALYTHKMLFWNSINTAMSLVVNSNSRTVNCMPPFHTGGWNVLTTPFFHHGGYTCLTKTFDASNILHLIEKEKASIFMGVPTMLKMLADLSEFEKADLSSLLYVIVGGEPMPLPLIDIWHQKGVPIRQGFGMTEVGPNLTSLHQDDAVHKMGSIGRPNFYVDIKIVDESGQEVVDDQAGELLLRGPMVTPGYWQNEEASRSSFLEGWFKTGDRVFRDADGYLFVVDRIKNMYISGGENVYPAEIERILLSHPKVNEAAVVAMPDKKWGESGCAFIVLNQKVSEKILLDFCRSKLAKFKVPKSFVFLEALPKNDTGKIDRKALKDRVHTSQRHFETN